MIEAFVGFGIITLVLGFGIGSALLRIRELNEDEWRTRNGEPIKSRMIEDMWVCKECGAFNSPYNKRCGKCFNIKSDKNEK